jgi:hypothetical protein
MDISGSALTLATLQTGMVTSKFSDFRMLSYVSARPCASPFSCGFTHDNDKAKYSHASTKSKKILTESFDLPYRRASDGGVIQVMAVEKEMKVSEPADGGALEKQGSGKRSVHYLTL